jgi:hypothetical protein
LAYVRDVIDAGTSKAECHERQAHNGGRHNIDAMVRAARGRGLLEPASSQGKARGWLTSKAKALLGKGDEEQ